MNMMRRDLPGAPLRQPNAQPNSTVNPQGAAPRPVPPSPRPLPNTAPRPVQPVAAPLSQSSPQPRAMAGSPISVAPRAMSGAGARPQPKTEELLAVIRQLTELLTKENAALKRHRTDEVKTFTERKEQLARLYQGHMNAVHRDPGMLKALDPAKRAALTQQAMRLGELMQENAALLKGNIQSINMLFKAVTDAVKEKQEKMSAAYSRSGAMGNYIAKRSLAVSFNQTM